MGYYDFVQWEALKIFLKNDLLVKGDPGTKIYCLRGFRNFFLGPLGFRIEKTFRNTPLKSNP